MKKEFLYSEPQCEELTALGVEMICQSPTEGGLEGVQEEDWVI